MATTIHFHDFEDMLDELIVEEPVRINILTTISYVFVDQPDYSKLLVGLHVRQLQGNTVLSWMIPFGEYEAYRGMPVGENMAQVKSNAIVQAEEIRSMVIDRLFAHNKNFHTRPGVIDLGAVTFEIGYWSVLDIQLEEIGGDEPGDQVEETYDVAPDPQDYGSEEEYEEAMREYEENQIPF